ncbi:MAG: DUF3185 domain-containing protein [Candidatus Eisenbacteria bacterium]|uniref:DUF3185 domain-containing protein n=1 Tax=Eiseniibacteriota bacterium TaxID=2212470 RepID=A0A538TNN8_UNCEI|nr:MAG: DUF3185 domain-containing protein [Candidatus Eisenbacteria bacterium]
MMKLIGIALIILGIISLVWGGIHYNDQKTVIQMGDFKATATEQKTIPISPVVGVIALIGGVALLMIDKRRA